MSAASTPDFVALTQALLDSIAAQDWEGYASFCSPEMTCFEPEARGALVVGLEFHRDYFIRPGTRRAQTICSPSVRMLGTNAALICFTRLVQRVDDDGKPCTDRYEETRLWQRLDGVWKMVHLHRS